MPHKSYQYKIQPTDSQKVLFAKTFGCVRFLWNQSVAAWNMKEQRKTSTQLRHEFCWMLEVSAGAIQQKEIDFKNTLTQKFKNTRQTKVGNLRFKSKKDRQSYRLPGQKFKIDFNSQTIRLEKIGKVKMFVGREFNGTPISATISMDKCGDYFISILVNEEINCKAKTRKSVGIDVGIKALITTSDGLQVLNLPENKSKIKHIQRRLSRKTVGSSRFHKLKHRLAKLHRKETRKREWVLHNISAHLVENYDLIVAEDLNVTGMMKNHQLAWAISRSSWSNLMFMLEYKSNWYGKEFVKINRFFPSSKTCNACGKIKDGLKLSDRVYTCECGYSCDRDLNAAKNIKSVGATTDTQTAMGCKTYLIEQSIKQAIPDDLLRLLN